MRDFGGVSFLRAHGIVLSSQRPDFNLPFQLFGYENSNFSPTCVFGGRVALAYF